ncbi:MAG: ATP-dependent helicase RecG [Pseudomonadota bacterium]|jgi:ATP-dependent DNA helicase RecG
MNKENSPIRALTNVGVLTEQRLARLGILTIQDLLFHLPLRYQDRTRCYLIAEAKIGQEIVIEGTVESCEIKSGKRRILTVVLSDESGIILLKWFHFNPNQHYQIGEQLRCFGEIKNGLDCLEIIHPETRRVELNTPLENTLTPIYPTTEGLFQPQLRKLIKQALQFEITDLLPSDLTKDLPTLLEALQIVHSPKPEENIEELLNRQHPAQQRLALEELLAHHLSLRVSRQQVKCYHAPIFIETSKTIRSFIENLPFALTNAQKKVYQEILDDVTKSRPMQRLIQGDVGAGKTVVAALAALHAVESGLQVAIMSPLELLAEQHFRTFHQWFEKLGILTVKLLGSLTKKNKEKSLLQIANGEAQIVIGTHALFQEQVQFQKLGLIVIDEQHRFGVEQRLALKEKGTFENNHPHQLIMTATPIPRTLALTMYADLDISIIDELPPGRTPIVTVAMPASRRSEIIQRVSNACQNGRQAYWVCPLIEESEQLEIQAAQATFEQLCHDLPHLKIGLAHGKLKAKEKEKVMKSFQSGDIDVLVATTVIEVGVDVANASLMIIDNPERLGLSQLHQLRGRVGRGTVESFCVLLYQPPLSNLAKSRLAILRESLDGFFIAQRDLELRGPGEVLGTRQTGIVKLKVADWQQHHDLIGDIPPLAEYLLEKKPEIVAPLIRRWVYHSPFGEVY